MKIVLSFSSQRVVYVGIKYVLCHYLLCFRLFLLRSILKTKKNFTIHIISISYYQLEWVQFEKNTMTGISIFCPKFISYFCLLNEQKSDSNIQTFSKLSLLTISNQCFLFFLWIKSYFTYFNEKKDNYFWTNIRNSNHSEKKKKNPLKYITFS